MSRCGTSQIDYNGRWCMSSAAAAGIRCFGLDRGLPFPVTDIGSAHAVLLLGANPAETMPPFLTHLVRAADAGGLMVADPRLTPTAAKAIDGGGLHLQLRPGTDAALALGMLHLAVTEGYADRRFIAERTSGFDDLWPIAAQWLPERVERVTGVAVTTMRAAVAALARARDTERGAYVLSARGSEQHASGTDTVTAFIALALALGLPGNPGTGFGTITGQGNGQGGREHGQKADQLPGYRKIDDPAARAHVAAVWGIDPADLPGPGRSAFELLSALGTDGGPRVLLVHGSNPVVSAPDARVVTERLAALDLLVVSDFVLSETAALADVVLPVLQWAEEEGTLTNLEGRVLRRREALDRARRVPQRARRLERARRPDRLQHRLPHRPAGRLRRAAPGLGRRPGRLLRRDVGAPRRRREPALALHDRAPAGHAAALPRPLRDAGRARPLRARSTTSAPPRPTTRHTPSSRRRAACSSTTSPAPRPASSTSSRRRRARCSSRCTPTPPSAVGLADGDLADVVSRRGRTRAAVRVDEDMRPDVVFLPFHWAGDARANSLTHAALDPTSRMPEFKACAVRLEAIA